jgi:hypothetical protein
MPGNPKPRKDKPTPKRASRVPKLPDILRQTHVICDMNINGETAWCVCGCGEVFIHKVEGQMVAVALFKLSEQFRAHRDG